MPEASNLETPQEIHHELNLHWEYWKRKKSALHPSLCVDTILFSFHLRSIILQREVPNVSFLPLSSVWLEWLLKCMHLGTKNYSSIATQSCIKWRDLMHTSLALNLGWSMKPKHMRQISIQWSIRWSCIKAYCLLSLRLNVFHVWHYSKIFSCMAYGEKK